MSAPVPVRDDALVPTPPPEHGRGSGGIAALAVRRPLGTCILFFSVLVVGLVALRDLAVDLLPSVDAPWISITTFYDGVAPQEIETLITRPIEQQMSTVAGVEQLDSSSSEGLSRVSLRFAWGTDLEVATNDVREMLDRVRGRLPEEADTPFVYKFDLSATPVAFLGLSGGGDVRRLRYLAEEVLARRLEAVPGVASAGVRGGRVREIQVLLDARRLAALGIPATEVSAALARENRNVSAGDMTESGREVVIRATGEYESVREIEQVVVARRGDRSIRVGDLGEVVDGWQDLQSELWIDGQRGIRLYVSKQSGSNTVEVAEALQREIDEINRDYEGRLKLVTLWDGSKYIESAVTNVQSSVMLGGLLAVAILLLFLRNVRATLVIGVAIPISVLATFALMFLAEISLNLISLGGLALGVGMLVDNSIVILEAIYAKLEAGRTRVQAAIEGTQEMALSVIAGTLTTIAVFAPVVFIEGFAAIFFGEMALVVSFALLCSLVVALTLVPVLGVLILRPGDEPPGWKGVLFRRASRMIAGVLDGYESRAGELMRRPGRVVLVAVVLLAGSVAAVPLVGTELLPETDEGRIYASVELPVGTPLETTMEVMKGLEAKVREAVAPEELENLTVVAGPEAAWRPAGANTGSMEIVLVPVGERSRGVNEVLAALRKATAMTPGAEIRMNAGSSNPLMRFMRGGGDDRLRIEIFGHDIATADELAERVSDAVEGVKGVANVYVARESGKKEVYLVPDRQRLSDLGLTGKELADAVEHYVLGRVATYFRDGGEEHAVRVRLAAADREQVERLGSLPVVTPSGSVVPIGSVARLERGTSPAAIARENQERVVALNVSIGSRTLSEVATDVRAAIAGVEVPSGFRVELAGELEEQNEAFVALLTGIFLAIFLVYVVLVVQFESLAQPLVIMTAVPFAAIGVVLTLLLTGTTFNLNSFLGCVVLVGIAVNNSIMLVDAIGHMRADGTPLRDAVVAAGRRRLRPVLMTTATTVLGMLPLAFGMGEGSEIQVPLARVIVGGLISSTLITLVFVPALYLVVERLAARRVSRAAAPLPVATDS